MRRPFEFPVWYFKPSGKFYTEAELRINAEVIVSKEVDDAGNVIREKCLGPYMNDAVDAIKDLRSVGSLPGLGSGNWDGPILINHPDGFPVLIMGDPGEP